MTGLATGFLSWVCGTINKIFRSLLTTFYAYRCWCLVPAMYSFCWPRCVICWNVPVPKLICFMIFRYEKKISSIVRIESSILFAVRPTRPISYVPFFFLCGSGMFWLYFSWQPVCEAHVSLSFFCNLLALHCVAPVSFQGYCWLA